MSSHIVPRRPRQPLRPAVDENAIRTTTRTTRTKASQPPEKPTTSTAGTRADQIAAAAKRKREALGEISNKNKLFLAAPPPKGGLKKPTTSSNVTRVPLGDRNRNTTTAVTRSKSVKPSSDSNQDQHVNDAMAVDTKPIRASQRMSTRTATSTTSVTSVASRRAGSTTSVASRNVQTVTTSNSHALPRSRAAATRRPLTNATNKAREAPTPDSEDVPAPKKRRTSQIDENPTLVEIKEDVKEEEFNLSERIVEEGLGTLEGEAKWDDLDKEDADDPLMVSEYVVEIFEYLKEVELQTLPTANYMDTQPELAWRMRGILIDWLVQIHNRFRLLPETLFLASNIIDRTLSSRVVSLGKLQLVGVTALFIASKYEEIMAPGVSSFVQAADGDYAEKDILESEQYILRTLDYNLSYPNPIHFLRRSSKADGYDLGSRTVAKYLIEISCLDHRLIPYTPSHIAAAGLWLARLILDKEEWTPNLEHYSSYTELEILPVAELMINYVLKPIRHDNFYKKYAGRKFMKVSVHVNGWALERWPEGTSVDLAGDLTELRRVSENRRLAGYGTLVEELDAPAA